MTFLQPWAFGLLALALGIITLYFLRRREERLVVSALWLWRQELERPRSALSFLWTNIGLLLLQLTALLALVLALTMPMLSQEASGGGRLALLIDGSASMQTRAGAHSRYERAVALAIEQIERLRPSKIAIIQAQREPRLLLPLTEDRAAAIRSLRESKPTFQADAAWNRLLQLLRSQSELSQFDEILYISDRPPADPEGITWVRVGASARNLALTGFAARPLPESSSAALWGRVENLSDVVLAGQVKIFAEEAEVFRERVRLAPGAAHDVSALYRAPAARQFRAQLDVDDDFAPDNQRYFWLPARQRLKLLWLGERNFFLERALSLYAELQIEFLANPSACTLSLEGRGDGGEGGCPAIYDLVIANNVTLPLLGAGRLLLVSSSLEPLIRIAGDIDVDAPLKLFNAAHALLEHIHISHLQPLRLRAAQLDAAVHTLAEAQGEPVLAVHSTGPLRFVYLGVRLQEAALVLTPSFPILIQNSLRWLLPELEPPEDQYPSAQYPTPGFYNNTAINIDPRESSINLLNQASNGLTEKSPRVAGSAPLRSQVSIWQYGAWGALIFLFLEFFFYQRALFRGRSRRERQL